ncbi:hypothetical protein SAMN05446935_8485 [Burkholderia sp. YR290]|nr:hypothetical protein SAMN05446935_8485 [Burkholderia sp. YR290]
MGHVVFPLIVVVKDSDSVFNPDMSFETLKAPLVVPVR